MKIYYELYLDLSVWVKELTLVSDCTHHLKMSANHNEDSTTKRTFL
ncbi:MAG: Unknown protein [uncultured Sulfurovum sp.]|uniref:Uncharacterized protein n=1 Tax=uncultured Sulfurovum sp. TaxID=269237 RepID=A0A6S6TVC7_9BACT|nr:MAG: Unknown protein [uncultured Sulfurovum sp.]